jgi:hypothetical protein
LTVSCNTITGKNSFYFPDGKYFPDTRDIKMSLAKKGKETTKGKHEGL